MDSLKIATEYRVHCSSDVLQYDIKPDELLSLLADVYYEYFLENYAENDQILNLDLGSLDDMDYMDVDDYLSMKAFELSSYIKNFGYEDSSFRMDDTGETFASLGEKIDNFSNVELERYRSFVLQNGLSTDKVDYSTRMDYENRLLQVKYEKNMAAYNVRLEAINLYDGLRDVDPDARRLLRSLDASLLLIPRVGFLPGTDPRVVATIDAIRQELTEDGLVLRYDSSAVDDGLPPGEGAFLACTFWLADNYALMGRHEEARATFERLLALRNDVGLLSEEYDTTARRLVGNFPQAFSHVPLIDTARTLTTAHAGSPTDARAREGLKEPST